MSVCKYFENKCVSSSGVGSGVIIGVVLGTVGMLIAAAFVFWIVRRKRNLKRSEIALKKTSSNNLALKFTSKVKIQEVKDIVELEVRKNLFLAYFLENWKWAFWRCL
jgi:hypothetical protein